MFSLAVTFAPAIGPTIGGYLTENYGWQTIFFVNVVPTAVMVTILYLTLERQPMQLGLLREGDWLGIATMAIGLSALQAVLEEGNKDDWFGSSFIVRLAMISAVSLALFIWIELTVEKPLMRLRLLTQWNFGMGTIAAVFLGFALFGSVYLLPAYLGQVQRYNAEQIGNVLAWTGLPQLLLIPLVPKLMQRIDPRYIAVTGLLLFAASSFMNICDVARLFRRPVLAAQYRARRRPGADARPAELRHARQRRAAGCAGGLRHLQHDAQSRRRDRHRGARHHRHQARAVPFQHHRPGRRSRPRGGPHPDRSVDQLFPRARRARPIQCARIRRSSQLAMRSSARHW